MKIIHLDLYKRVIEAVLVTLVGFMFVFGFFIVLDELSNIGRSSVYDPNVSFGVSTLIQLVLLETPFLAYDLLPICVLIGAVYALSRLAVQSEFTVMRSGGFSPFTAIRLMSMLGFGFAVLTFITGDYLSPLADTHKVQIKAQFDGRFSTGLTGGWLREQRMESGYATLNVGELLPTGEISKVRIFEFDGQGRLVKRIDAKTAHLKDGVLSLREIQMFVYPKNVEVAFSEGVVQQKSPSLEWPTSIQAEMISSTLLDKQRLNTFDLYQVIRHLQANKQSSQRQEIDFWSKLIYPLSCVVMALMALPFAYLHFRQSGVSLYVFIGIMLGISFFLLSNMFAYIGNIQGWRPWLAAASPSLIYVTLSMAAVTWRVLRR